MSTDEWEYEYCTHETEALYFTLDLTTHVPNAISDTPVMTSGHASRNHSAPRADPSNRNRADSDSASEDEVDLPRLQILDLHSSNPLIKFEESVYSCYWTTDLGTQFHIAAAGETSHPLRKGTVLDVLGISRARLLGKPVGLVDRNAPPPTSTSTNSRKASAEPNVGDFEEEDDDNTLTTTTGPLKIPRSILKTPTSRSQATFLEKLSLIKQAKGENDQVPIIAVKHYVKPENAEAIKRQAEDDDRNSALVNIDGRKRRRRRPMGVKPRDREGAGRPGRRIVERGLEGAVDGEDVAEEVSERGMFGPGVRRRREGLSGAYSLNAQFTDYGEVEEGERRRASLVREPAMEATASGQGDTSPWKPISGADDGHLSFQTRPGYRDTVGAEGADTTPTGPMMPPWMGGEDGQ